ncbi:hypothetical protein ASE95_00340 [Sphingomonas sp. Leaf231]|uniref:DUF6628 family protein n=1 Tax=Sphingomonas sp. Leaf231 TaxID=1736301 RepID=UPI0006FB7C08|nr:DUF6628 family protein [Sphingomonas sp. Leaf231]KQN93450.1 hypothetical protein ASE95_00340 [Sphingomonas sp. Leaf231]
MTQPTAAHLAADLATNVLPHALPECGNARAVLFAMRRMGANGLSDARAAHGFFTAFGEAFRRPLLLMRALMADMATNAAVPIAIAPCCCARMTPSEHALLAIVARVETRTDNARLLLQDLLGQRHVDAVLASAAALAAAFADEGRPVAMG